MPRTTATRKLQQPQGPIEFTLPHRFLPRSYQRDLFVAFERGYKRFVLCWHRRSGKDRACLALTTLAMAQRPGLYLHVYPTKTLAKEAMWNALHEGGKFLDAFPVGWMDGEPNNTEMLIRVKALPGHPAGSIWKLTGADDPNSLVGINPVGIVLSEFSLHESNLWDQILSPILNENNGWIIFNFTPRGKNHAYQIYKTALANPAKWFCSLKTVEDTKRDAPGERGGPVVSLDKIHDERKEGRAEEIIQQESYCSFEGYAHGTIFGDCLQTARKDKRIRPIVRNVGAPVGVCFDLGQTDGTAAWYWQLAGRAIEIIDYDFTRGKDAEWWLKHLHNKPYWIGRLQLPWDANQKHFSTTESPAEFFQNRTRWDIQVAEKFTIQQRIDMTRRCFPLMVFDEEKCGRQPEPGNTTIPSGLEALGEYKRKWDDEKQDFSGDPVHDIHSHAADALCTGAVCGFDAMQLPGMEEDEKPCVTKFNPFTYDRPQLIGAR